MHYGCRVVLVRLAFIAENEESNTYGIGVASSSVIMLFVTLFLYSLGESPNKAENALEKYDL